MKLVWSPEIATKAYIDTVKAVSKYHSADSDHQAEIDYEVLALIVNSGLFMQNFVGFCFQCKSRESGVSELVSAMAAGWNASLIVETWSEGGSVETSIGLAIAARHSGGRHVCVVPDERSRKEYAEVTGEAGMSPELVVGEAEEVMEGLVNIDFLVVDSRRRDFTRVLRLAKLSPRGAVLVCKNASLRCAPNFRWRSEIGDGSRLVVRSVFLPVGKGLDMAHVAATVRGNSGPSKAGRRWIKHVDRQSGEEYVIRK